MDELLYRETQDKILFCNNSRALWNNRRVDFLSFYAYVNDAKKQI